MGATEDLFDCIVCESSADRNERVWDHDYNARPLKWRCSDNFILQGQ